jgi:NTP pyrophosphatase (non-canonical NTP hydrolase)
MSDDTNTAPAFAKLLAVVSELRARCPWDREQKLADTPRHLIEEAYEVADAIARGNPPDIAEELGDVIVQCLFTGVILGEPRRNLFGDIRTFTATHSQRLRNRSSRTGNGSRRMSAQTKMQSRPGT